MKITKTELLLFTVRSSKIIPNMADILGDLPRGLDYCDWCEK